MQNPNFEYMRRLSADIRVETVKAISKAGAGHIGGAVSIADVLAVLYGGAMNIRPSDPDWEHRDWLVLSKGHAGPGLYAALALTGYFPMDWLDTVNKPGTRLPSHCDMKRTPGIDMTTGSLGQGLSAAVGIALGNRINGIESYVYCIVGDGEINEGQIWEAAQTASHNKIDNLILFVDWNKKQLDGKLEDVNDPIDIAGKFEAFGFEAQTVKGYDVEEIYSAIERAKKVKGKPSVIVLDTLKGLGICFAENAVTCHFMAVDEKMEKEAIDVIEKRYEQGAYPGGESRK
ncbi:MAG: transketolase [Eubacteriales bacterium]|nr:transketolase [Eubacteriales bacterium]